MFCARIVTHRWCNVVVVICLALAVLAINAVILSMFLMKMGCIATVAGSLFWCPCLGMALEADMRLLLSEASVMSLLQSKHLKDALFLFVNIFSFVWSILTTQIVSSAFASILFILCFLSLSHIMELHVYH